MAPNVTVINWFATTLIKRPTSVEMNKEKKSWVCWFDNNLLLLLGTI